MKTKKLALTRWHKVVERINAAIGEEMQTAKSRLVSTSFNVTSKGAYSAEKVASMRKEGWGATEQVWVLLEDLARIRMAVAEANMKVGISEKLTLINVATRQLDLLRSLESANEGKMSFEAFQSLDSASYVKSDMYSRGDTNVGIEMILPEVLVELKEKTASLKRKIDNLSDEISDANKTQVEVTLSDKAIEVASL